MKIELKRSKTANLTFYEYGHIGPWIIADACICIPILSIVGVPIVVLKLLIALYYIIRIVPFACRTLH